jgi:membrane associated rhomboid family serine protease
MTYEPQSPRLSFKRALFIVGGLLAAMWAVELIDWLGGRWLELDHFGIRPRQSGWLLGIALAPFLHVGWGHLAANTVPFFILGLLVIGRGEKRFWVVSAGIVLLSGLGVWLLGRAGTVHVGASGVVFGYFGYLLTAGVVERSLVAVVRAVLVTGLYGSILWGVLPNRSGVSWEGHLGGLLTGIALALLFRPRREGSGKEGA